MHGRIICIEKNVKSSSDSDFEKFIATTKQRRNKTNLSSADETKVKRSKVKRPKKLKREKEGEDFLYQDKENLLLVEGVGAEGRDEDEVEVVQPVLPRSRFKRRAAGAELGILEGFLTEGLDREDVQMFKLALSRLKGEGDPLAHGLGWAHYPHNILKYHIFV